MLTFLLIVVLSVLSLFLTVLLRSFETMRLSELKRQARSGNVRAARVYRVRSRYGTELWLLLWFIIGVSTAGVVILLDTVFWQWLAIFLAAILLVGSRLILPRLKRPKITLGLAARCAPVFDVVLRYSHPLLIYPARAINRITEWDVFDSVHSKDELLELLKASVTAAKLNRFEADVAFSALTFGEKVVSEIMVPIGTVKTVDADTLLSPVELGELHDSGFSRFPVKDAGNQYIGTLFLKDVVEMRSTKHVRDMMRPGAFYISEHAQLDQAMRAFLKTHHHQFLVVNDFEEIVGVVSIEDIIEQIIGKQIIDEFDQYDDLRAVAEARAKKIRADRDETVVE